MSRFAANPLNSVPYTGFLLLFFFILSSNFLIKSSYKISIASTNPVDIELLFKCFFQTDLPGHSSSAFQILQHDPALAEERNLQL